MREKPYEIVRLRSVDRSVECSTGGTRILHDNLDRVWASFVNLGPNAVDIYWIDYDGSTVTGRLRLLAGGSLTIDNIHPWYGALSGTAQGADTTLVGVEVFKQQ